MGVKEMLKRFEGKQQESKTVEGKGDEAVRADIEARMIRLNKSFVETILPGIFEVESDLNQAGYWNQFNIGQATSLSSGKPNIKSAELVFWPERVGIGADEAKLRESAYKAKITASGSLRKIEFRIEFPKRIPPGTEIREKVYGIDEIDTDRINAFLENFVHGALEAYTSDRMLR